MAEYVVMRVDEGTMGIIGNILFQNYSCVRLWASFIVFSKVNICSMYSLHMELIPCGLMCVTIWSSGIVYLLDLLQHI